jgi:hypothetical protein
MKKSLILLPFLLIILRGVTTAQNPYESLGKTTEVLTLSNGKYQEFMTNDTIVQIGSVLFNTITNEVVFFLSENTLRLMDADLTTRFLSVDPIGRKYPELTPYQFASNMPISAIDLDGEEAKLIITDNITGYTMANVYAGEGSKPSLRIVPTYEMILVDASDPTKAIATYNVTRDAYYNKMSEKDGQSNEIQINRAFEPADASQNTYDAYRRQYPKKPATDLEAWNLREQNQDNTKEREFSEFINASPFTVENNTGIESPRKNLGKASGVMIHIGGLYEKTVIEKDKNGNDIEVKKLKIAGSEGCFGVVPRDQIKPTKEEAKADFESGAFKARTPANAAYKQYFKFVTDTLKKLMYKDTRPENEKGNIQVEIKKRN